VPARIAPRIAEGAELLERDAGDARLFHQLAQGGAIERFVRLDEPARERPGAFEGSLLSLDEEDREVPARMQKRTLSAVTAGRGYS